MYLICYKTNATVTEYCCLPTLQPQKHAGFHQSSRRKHTHPTWLQITYSSFSYKYFTITHGSTNIRGAPEGERELVR